eukprot:m.148370 g.148370  ORF g.148370 m.148370 type:complete len:297 (-) comp30590_c0_seq1:288-1178(-)
MDAVVEISNKESTPLNSGGFGNLINAEQSASLRKWNLATCALHLMTGIVIFAITNADLSVPVYTTYADPGSRDPATWGPELTKVGNAVIGYFSGTFLILVAIDHFVVATVFKRTYEYYLARGQNPFRWAEYSVSAAVMHVQIALLSGVMDLHLLIAIFVLTSSTMVFGHFQEVLNCDKQGRPKEKSLFAFWIGFIPHFGNWGIIMSYFFYSTSNGDPPGFVWALIFILFFLDATFAVNQWLQQKEVSKWKNYLYGEYVFIVLSFTAKQLLAWVNYGGSNSLNTDPAGFGNSTTPSP